MGEGGFEPPRRLIGLNNLFFIYFILFYILYFFNNSVVIVVEGGFEPWTSLLETPRGAS